MPPAVTLFGDSPAALGDSTLLPLRGEFLLGGAIVEPLWGPYSGLGIKMGIAQQFVFYVLVEGASQIAAPHCRERSAVAYFGEEWRSERRSTYCGLNFQ